MPRTRHTHIYIYNMIIDMDFLYQFNLGLIAPLFTGSFHEMFEKNFFFQKFAGLWLVGKVDNHVAIYGSKVAEGFSAFQRRLVNVISTICGTQTNLPNTVLNQLSVSHLQEGYFVTLSIPLLSSTRRVARYGTDLRISNRNIHIIFTKLFNF